VPPQPISIPFVKAHGLGNDFLLIEESQLRGNDPWALAHSMCHRHTGIGADGLVVLGLSANADASYRIFNSDGSEAGLSGNGLRCAAAWMRRRDPGTQGHISLETRVGLRELFFLRMEGSAFVFRTEIGKPAFRAEDVPFLPSGDPGPPPIVDYPLDVAGRILPVTVLSMGNPQCITFWEDFSNREWLRLGAAMEIHLSFPDRANIGFVSVVDSGRIEARFWERGAGHTTASGTGSCACAVAAHLARGASRRLVVGLELGEMEVNWREDDLIELTGPAEITAEGTYSWAPVQSA